MEQFSARVSPFRMLLIICGGIGFVVLGLWMAGAFGEPPSSRRYGSDFLAFLGWVSVIFFGACTAAGLRRLGDKSEQLTVSAYGVYWKQWSDATIPWSEIVDVSIWQFKKQKSIILTLKDRDRFPSNRLLGKLSGANRAMTGGDIPISLTGLNKSFDEAWNAIAAFRR